MYFLTFLSINLMCILFILLELVLFEHLDLFCMNLICT